MRSAGGSHLLCVVPRLWQGIVRGEATWPIGDAVWGDTTLVLDVPVAQWRNVVTDEVRASVGRTRRRATCRRRGDSDVSRRGLRRDLTRYCAFFVPWISAAVAFVLGGRRRRARRRVRAGCLQRLLRERRDKRAGVRAGRGGHRLRRRLALALEVLPIASRPRGPGQCRACTPRPCPTTLIWPRPLRPGPWRPVSPEGACANAVPVSVADTASATVNPLIVFILRSPMGLAMTCEASRASIAPASGQRHGRV